jgi:predicted short-subunit dehydrogenase-like oxidoreductase (DUF2520 family)
VNTSSLTVGIIGAGKVGGTLARLWHQRGYTIGAVFSRSAERAAALAALVDAQAVTCLQAVPEHVDLTVIAVPDDVIETVAEGMAGAAWSGKAAVHTCGSKDASALAALAERGAMIGSLHPAFPFADVESAVERLPGATFAVEADAARLHGWLDELVAALDGRSLAIPPGGKALYHAALVMASNYTVTLYAVAEALLMGLGADRESADGALDTLLAGTVENLRDKGIPMALTGPLTRMDVGTIAAHLQALEAVDFDLTAMYQMLARLSYPMLTERGLAPEALERLFQGEHT